MKTQSSFMPMTPLNTIKTLSNFWRELMGNLNLGMRKKLLSSGKLSKKGYVLVSSLICISS
jgi:hypothetical protein